MLSKVIQALNNAGVRRHTNNSIDTLCFSDLSLEETPQKELVKGPTLTAAEMGSTFKWKQERVDEASEGANAEEIVTKLFADAKSPVRQTQQGMISFTADQSVGATWHQCRHGWVCLQDEARLGPGFDHERCTKLECTEPIRKKQLKRERKAARRRARAVSTQTEKYAFMCQHQSDCLSWDQKLEQQKK